MARPSNERPPPAKGGGQARKHHIQAQQDTVEAKILNPALACKRPAPDLSRPVDGEEFDPRAVAIDRLVDLLGPILPDGPPMAIADTLFAVIEAAAHVVALSPPDTYRGSYPVAYASNEGACRVIDRLRDLAIKDAQTAAASAETLDRVRGHAERTGRLPPLDWRIHQQLDRAPKPPPPAFKASRADVQEYVEAVPGIPERGRLTEAGRQLNRAARSWALATWREGAPA